VPIFALLAVPAGPWWVAGLLFAAFIGMPSIRVLADILVIRRAAPSQRGRVVAALMTMISLGTPIGVAGCGLLLQYVPAQAAVLMLAGLLALSVLACSGLRSLRQAQWPA
jgi:predicted MFS family arabinose efflux permease